MYVSNVSITNCNVSEIKNIFTQKYIIHLFFIFKYANTYYVVDYYFITVVFGLFILVNLALECMFTMVVKKT